MNKKTAYKISSSLKTKFTKNKNKCLHVSVSRWSRLEGTHSLTDKCLFIAEAYKYKIA